MKVLTVKNILADTGYISGGNYADMESRGLIAYIPPHGTYKGGPDGFVHYKKEDYYLCPNGKKARFRKVKEENGSLKKFYATKTADCRECPLKAKCLGKLTQKRFSVIYCKDEYERTIERVDSPKGQYYKRKRHSTVEPVLGVLTQFMGMRKDIPRALIMPINNS